MVDFHNNHRKAKIYRESEFLIALMTGLSSGRADHMKYSFAPAIRSVLIEIEIGSSGVVCVLCDWRVSQTKKISRTINLNVIQKNKCCEVRHI